MNGIQSLLPGPQAGPQQAPGQAQPPGQAPGQAQPPGQAPMPGMQPQQQGPQQAAQPLTPMLSQLGIPQLQALLMNPGSQVPKFALLTAIDKKIKEQQAMQAVQGANAQQQAQQQQQQGTVADQILQMAQQQQPVMAAHGGMMRGYSGGGVVAFQSGGATSYPVEDQPWWKSLPADALLRMFLEAKDRPSGERSRGRFPSMYGSAEAPVEERDTLDAALEQAYGDTESRAKDVLAADIPRPVDTVALERVKRLTEEGPQFDIRQRITPQLLADLGAQSKTVGPSERAGLERQISQMRQQLPAPKPEVGLPAAAQLAGEAARQKPPARPGIASLVEDEIRRREGTRTLPPELVAAQERLAKAAERDVQLRNEEMRAARAAAEKARAEAMQRASGMSAEDYFNLAARIGGARKGEVVQRAAQGLGEAQARQRLGREAANKAFAEFEKTEREANALTRRIEMQELQRQAEIQKGNFDRAMAIDEKIAGLRIDLDNTLQERADKAEGLRLQGITAEAAKTTAAAAQTRAERENVPAQIQIMEWMRKPENRKLAEEIERAKGREERAVKLYEQYTKNKLMLGDVSFEDYVIAFEKAFGGGMGTGAGSAPPDGAVRLKGQQ